MTARPYFTKFAKLPENADMLILLLDRIASSDNIIVDPDEDHEKVVCELCHFMVVLLSLQSCKDLSKERSEAVQKKLVYWKDESRDSGAGEMANRALQILEL